MIARALGAPLTALLAAVFVLIAMSAQAVAQTAAGAPPFDAWSETVASAEARLSDDTIPEFTVERWIGDLETLIQQAQSAAQSARASAAPARSQLGALGPPPEDGLAEAESLAAERTSLQNNIAELEATARRAEAIAARAEQALVRLREYRRAAFTKQLMTRSDSPLAPETLRLAGLQMAEALKRSREHHQGILARLDEAGMLRTWAFALAFGLALAVGLIVFLRKVVVNRLMRLVSPDSGEMRKLLVAIGVTMGRLAIPLVALGAVQFSLERFTEFGFGELTVLRAAVRGVTVIIVVYALAYAYYAPGKPVLRLADLPDANARRASNWAVTIAVVAAADILLFAFGDFHALGEEALAVMNLGVVSAGAFAFWRFLMVNRGSAEEEAPRADQASTEKAAAEAAEPEHDDDEDDEPEDVQIKHEPIEASLSRFARIFALAVASFAPLASAAGFYALSRYAIENVVLTTALFGVCTLLYAVVSGGVDALATSSGAVQSKGERPADVSLAPIVFGAFLAIAAIPVVALIWGVTQDDLLATYSSIASGFTIGDFRFSPFDVFLFAAIFVIGVIATRTVQSILRGVVLPRTKLDEGARASLISGVGYIGFPLAALAAVGAAGLDLSNIAIVAGALSVGIGFGLQNVVNNFVSGIILLVERPVKVGDWIVVGGEHGYVRKINVRSTEIQTFDRTSLIVPNSELISSTVTNYTHNDLIGRVIVPIGVAYGTDPRKVERILMEIARGNRMLRRYPPPQVVFMAFGDSSLDFELRGILRDVNQILATRSDINFEIARRFAEEGIEIPFPQRDINLRDIDRLEAAIRGDSAPKTC